MAAIQLKNVVKKYGKGKHELQAIHGVSADVADRELTVIVGPSGCGKSTLLRMVARLEEVSAARDAIIHVRPREERLHWFNAETGKRL